MTYSINTKVVYTPSTDKYLASVPPLYQLATFKQASLEEFGEYDYTRSGNPTRTTIQNQLAALMKANHAFAVLSGMGAADIILRLLLPGEEVIAGDDLYGGTHRLLTFLHTKGWVKVKHVDTTDVDAVVGAVTPATRIVFLESPTNPLIKVVDVRSIAKRVKQVNPNTLIVFDNTMMSPVLMTPLDLGVDIQYESATKYLNGHHDIMAGVIATRSQELADQIYFVINSTGAGLAPFDCWLLARGIRTLALRVERQQENAAKIAEFLESAGFKVRYPGLKSHPQHALHASLCKGAGGVLSFETGLVALSRKICEAATIFGIAVSFGCVNLLISMPCLMSHALIDAKTREERAFPEDLIRLCIGIESIDDLLADLKAALVKANAVRADGLDVVRVSQPRL